jgi:ribosomal-protein-alanine N-acetyltransferase
MQTRQVKLRPTEQADLAVLFHFQLDQVATYLAAFMPKDHTDQEAYIKKYTRFLQEPTIHMQTILVEETIAGSIAKFEVQGEAEITYWLDRPFWGKGFATTALTTFLTLESTRPLLGRVAFDNVGSQRVLEKCGFIQIGTDTGFARARQAVIEEFIYKLTQEKPPA